MGAASPPDGAETAERGSVGMASVATRVADPFGPMVAANDSGGYRPSADEPFMCRRQQDYFRRKLRDWKDEYGYCEVTGEPISLGRLEARPIATMTVEAQERHERHERVSRED